MLRLIVLVLIVTGLALGMSRIVDRPGELVIDWLGYQVKTDVFTAGGNRVSKAPASCSKSSRHRRCSLVNE